MLVVLSGTTSGLDDPAQVPSHDYARTNCSSVMSCRSAGYDKDPIIICSDYDLSLLVDALKMSREINSYLHNVIVTFEASAATEDLRLLILGKTVRGALIICVRKHSLVDCVCKCNIGGLPGQ